MRACLTAALGRRGVLARERGDRACRSELRRPGFSQRLPDGAAVYRGADRRGRRGGAPGPTERGPVAKGMESRTGAGCARRGGRRRREPRGGCLRVSAFGLLFGLGRSATPLRPAEDTVTAHACGAGTSCLRRSSTPESAAQRSCGRSRPSASRPSARRWPTPSAATQTETHSPSRSPRASSPPSAARLSVHGSRSHASPRVRMAYSGPF
jgi:hypothetical protein